MNKLQLPCPDVNARSRLYSALILGPPVADFVDKTGSLIAAEAILSNPAKPPSHPASPVDPRC